MKNIFNKILFIFAFTLLFMQPAYAYLDPGTGSYVLQLLIAAIVGMIFGIKTFWNNIKMSLSSIFSKKPETEDKK